MQSMRLSGGEPKMAVVMGGGGWGPWPVLGLPGESRSSWGAISSHRSNCSAASDCGNGKRADLCMNKWLIVSPRPREKATKEDKGPFLQAPPPDCESDQHTCTWLAAALQSSVRLYLFVLYLSKIICEQIPSERQPYRWHVHLFHLCTANNFSTALVGAKQPYK